MINLLQAIWIFALAAEAEECQEEVIFLQTALSTETRHHAESVAHVSHKAVEMMRSTSGAVVLVVIIVVMIVVIPLVVYSLSDGGSPGHRLLEGPKAAEARSMAGSRSQLRTPGAGSQRPTSQRLSVESQAQAFLPPTAHSPSDGPPVICRELVLPETEARFLIQAQSLRGGVPVVTILGGSGRQALLQAFLKEEKEGTQLWLHSMKPNSTVLDTPRAVVIPGRHPAHFEIYDRDLKPYGELEGYGPSMTLKCNGYPVLVVEASDELGCTAAQMDGRTLATGRLAPDAPPHVLEKLGGEAWRLRVVAGCDAIVVLSSMLTAMLLKRGRSSIAVSGTPSIQVHQAR